jgi:hypothetical protein
VATLLIGWLLGANGLPSSPLVWTSGGIAAVLTGLLLTALGLLAWQLEPVRTAAQRLHRRDRSRSAAPRRRLPNAA